MKHELWLPSLRQPQNPQPNSVMKQLAVHFSSLGQPLQGDGKIASSKQIETEGHKGKRASPGSAHCYASNLASSTCWMSSWIVELVAAALRRSTTCYNSFLGYSHNAIPLLGLERPQKSVLKHTTLIARISSSPHRWHQRQSLQMLHILVHAARPLLNPN